MSCPEHHLAFTAAYFSAAVIFCMTATITGSTISIRSIARICSAVSGMCCYELTVQMEVGLSVFHRIPTEATRKLSHRDHAAANSSSRRRMVVHDPPPLIGLLHDQRK